MLTPATISKTERKTEQYRKDAVERLCQGMSVKYFSAFLHGFYIGCDGVEEIYQKLLMQLLEGGRKHMMKKKGMTKNQKLKMLKTSKAKKSVKATKK
jgi:hypothetical protein